MRSLTLVAALAALLLALPLAAVAEDTEPISQPCDQAQIDAADFVATTDGVSATIATPSLPSPYPLGLGGEPDPLGFQDAATDVYTVLLDVNPDYLSATTAVGISWDHDGDLDMDVYYKGNLVGESHSFNPLDGNTEFADTGRVKHCETLEIHVRNYIAGPGDVALTVSASGFRDF